jgi:hypothetical protein
MSWKALLLGFSAFAGLTGTLAAVAAGPLFAEDPPAVPGQPYSAVAEIKSVTVFADGNRIVKPITSTLDRWVSTDLGITVQITETSSIGGTTTLNLQQIVRGEPEAALFAVPADYKRHELTVPARAAELSSTSTAVFTAVKKP